MAHTVVIGGGISGLATAWFLSRQGKTITVLESQNRVGGMIHTSHRQNYLIEHGPNSTLQKPGDPTDGLGRLVAGLDISERLAVANPQAARRYVCKNGRLLPLPASPPQFLRTPLFSWPAKLRLLLEPFVAQGDENESIGSFVTRRLGREFLDYAVEPFVSGVYAGNPWQLSVAAAVPRIYALEFEYGSLIRGALALGRLRKATGMPAGRLVAFDTGMELLPQTIAAKLPPDTVHTGSHVTCLEATGTEGWRVTWEKGNEKNQIQASQVVLAVPAMAAAQLLEPLSPVAAQLLKKISYAPIVSMGMGFKRSQVGHPLDGFGFLVPRRENVRTLGALFSSTLFARRAPEQHVLLTSFMGGATDPEAVHEAEQLLTDQVLQDLQKILNIQGTPELMQVTGHRQAIPQYALGHLDLLRDLDAAMAPWQGLSFRANWRDGISVADCVKNAEILANQLKNKE
ncbi:MAG: protoporphyrinogen oxidase [Magnetococcus sp. DMHC-1]